MVGLVSRRTTGGGGGGGGVRGYPRDGGGVHFITLVKGVKGPLVIILIIIIINNVTQ